MFCPPFFRRSKRYTVFAIASLCSTLFIFASLAFRDIPFVGPLGLRNGAALSARDALITWAQEYINDPLRPADFGLMGLRTEAITAWMATASSLKPALSTKNSNQLDVQLEAALVSLYPFLQHPSRHDAKPFSSLRQSFIPGSRGIVISLGKSHFRYFAHLMQNIRTVLKSKLPIQVVYAGDSDLPENYRTALLTLFPDIELLDIFTVFNDSTLNLGEGTWALKPFAVLASKFEQVISVDADAVFLQPPEVILDSHTGYLSTGALFFHDRLLWQNVFLERARWWRAEMSNANRTASETLLKSRVWTEGYAEEADSGVLLLDKRRLPVVTGLLHVCWQNSEAVREQITYRQTYGDKESWWFGLELSGVPYSFEEHYGAVLGQTEKFGGEDRVCSFSIAHVDDRNKLLWFNGSLLKNKALSQTEFLVSTTWMIGAQWIKGRTRADSSCMRGGQIRDVDVETLNIITTSIDLAKAMDEKLEEMGVVLLPYRKYILPGTVS